MDPTTLAALSIGSQTMAGLLSGSGKRTKNQNDIDYFTASLTKRQRDYQELLNQLFRTTMPQKVEKAGLLNTGLGLQNQSLQQLLQQRGQGFQKRGEVYNTAKGYLGKDIYDPQKTLSLAMQQIKPLLDNMKADFAQRGIGGGAESTGLANLALQASLGHLMRGYESNAYQTANRNMNLMNLMGGLYS